MARIQIDFPEQILFTTTIEVRVTDLNYGGHLGNDALLSLLHESRVRFLHALGFTELNVAGVGIIMADAGIQYKSEAYSGEILTIEIAVADFSKVSFDIFYRVHSNGRIVAIAKTGIVCYDYAAKKVMPVPAAFAAAVAEMEKR